MRTHLWPYGPCFIYEISKSLCKFDSGLFQPFLVLEMSPVKNWIVVSCCWVLGGPNQEKIFGVCHLIAWLANTSSAHEKIISVLQVFWHLNYHILVFFLSYIDLYRTSAGWYGQEPYLGPAQPWPWWNMGVWDEVIALKWDGMTNAHLKFSVSYGIIFDFI